MKKNTQLLIGTFVGLLALPGTVSGVQSSASFRLRENFPSFNQQPVASSSNFQVRHDSTWFAIPGNGASLKLQGSDFTASTTGGTTGGSTGGSGGGGSASDTGSSGNTGGGVRSSTLKNKQGSGGDDGGSVGQPGLGGGIESPSKPAAPEDPTVTDEPSVPVDPPATEPAAQPRSGDDTAPDKPELVDPSILGDEADASISLPTPLDLLHFGRDVSRQFGQEPGAQPLLYLYPHPRGVDHVHQEDIANRHFNLLILFVLGDILLILLIMKMHFDRLYRHLIEQQQAQTRKTSSRKKRS